MDANHAWHVGCESDPIRNDFILPAIHKIVDEIPNCRLVDIGASTGFIVEKLITNGAKFSEILIVEKCESRLNYAKSVLGGSIVRFLHSDVLSDPPPKINDFDVVLLCNLMVEIEVIDDMARRISQFVRPGGKLVVAHPDTLVDLVAHYPRLTVGDVSAYTGGRVKLDKTDKFTGTPYPFFAHRISSVIRAFCVSGLSLTDFERFEGGSAYVLLVFER